MPGLVEVAGLGPAGIDLVPPLVAELIGSTEHVYLRTSRHPAAELAPEAVTFDDVYEIADDFDGVYRTIVDRLAEAAATHGRIVYLVPGSPLILERSVAWLRSDDRVDVRLHPSMSFLDLVWSRLGVDPVESGVRLVDGHRFAVEAAGERGPLLVAHTHARHVLSDIKLAVEDEPSVPVTILARLGLPDEEIVEVDWADLDRSIEPDHLTCLWIPELAAPVGREIVRFWEVVRILREQCPWDQKQTHSSLGPHLLEEAHEVLEAIDALDDDGVASEHLEEELGDLLFQVVFHAVLGAEAGVFDLSDVARGIHDKLVHRHPHVFGDVDAETSDEVVANWERIKQAEKGRASLMSELPAGLPALHLTSKLQRKAATVGIAPPDTPTIIGDLTMLMSELRDPARLDADAIGELLFESVMLARAAGVDAETALRTRSGEFRRRFQAMELLAAERGVDIHESDAAVVAVLFAETPHL